MNEFCTTALRDNNSSICSHENGSHDNATYLCNLCPNPAKHIPFLTKQILHNYLRRFCEQLFFFNLLETKHAQRMHVYRKRNI